MENGIHWAFSSAKCEEEAGRKLGSQDTRHRLPCAAVALAFKVLKHKTYNKEVVVENFTDTLPRLLWQEAFGLLKLLLCERTRPPTAQAEANVLYFSPRLRSVDVNKPCQTRLSKSE